jgi:hypothetical protein
VVKNRTSSGQIEQDKISIRLRLFFCAIGFLVLYFTSAFDRASDHFKQAIHLDKFIKVFFEGQTFYKPIAISVLVLLIIGGKLIFLKLQQCYNKRKKS